ncbi:MAG: hypothetical protein U0768_05960 [Anaerolineae bacterium]
MMRDYPKPIKKLIRQYAEVAYERELRAELDRLAQGFAEWQAGQISSWDLSDRIHKYETGPSRELYKRYSDGSADANVAWAVHQGLMSRDEVAPEVLEALAPWLSFYEAQ